MVTSRNLLAENMVVKKEYCIQNLPQKILPSIVVLLCDEIVFILALFIPRYLIIDLEVFSEGRGSLLKHSCCSVLNFCADLVHYLVFQQTERKFTSFSSVAIR